MKEPSPTEIEAIDKGAVLVVAVLTSSGGNFTVESCFDYAERFVVEAKRRGYDPLAIMQLIAKT